MLSPVLFDHYNHLDSSTVSQSRPISPSYSVLFLKVFVQGTAVADQMNGKVTAGFAPPPVSTSKEQPPVVMHTLGALSEETAALWPG